MGAVDLVVQVESPPSVASGLQRVGRAGHQVGEVSRGVLFPKHRGDLVQTAVVVERMRAGAIESLRVPANPLDVLAQQIVADDRARRLVDVDELFDLVRRSRAVRRAAALGVRRDARPARRPLPLRRVRRAAAPASSGTASPARSPAGPAPSGSRSPAAAPSPTAGCSGSSWSAARGRAAGSASSTRRWSTSPGSATSSRSAPPAGGSRTSPTTGCWSPPRPASPGRLPFWKGDALGRPVELGAAIGAFTRELGALPRRPRRAPGAARPGSTTGPPATWSPTCRAARGHRARCPTTARWWSSGSATSSATGGWSCTRRTARRCTRRGRWRSTPGCASATASTARRWPPTTASCCGSPTPTPSRPAPTCSSSTPDEIERLVTAGGRRLGAVRLPVPRVRRPRPAAAPPRPRPPPAAVAAAPALGRSCSRSPRKYPSFPIVLEAVRECLQDVYDLPALVALMRDIGRARGPGRRRRDPARRRRSPGSLLFGYVAAVRLRGRLPARRAPGRRALPRPGPARRAARPRRAARAARPRRARRGRGRAAAARRPTAGPATPRASPTCCGCSAR